jgi:hydroxymethylpyrimidine pyrophosphatase-like HAD family hydrolase
MTKYDYLYFSNNNKCCDFMVNVRLIVTDVDDTVTPHYPNGNRDLTLAREAGEVISECPHVYRSALTGHYRDAVVDVLRAAHIDGMSCFEMGYLVGFPGGQLELLPQIANEPAVQAVRKLKQRLQNDGVASRSKNHGISADVIKRKHEMLSFDVFDKNGQGFVDRVLPELLDDDVLAYIQRGDVIVKNPGYAVDILPACVNKGIAMQHIMDYCHVTPENTLAIGDSYHSDREMFHLAQPGYAACPANADDEVKYIVRQFGKKGFVSDVPCDKGGFVNILEHAIESGWF